ncbi:MAG: hypothetical protein F6K10_33475, partial [Moorea sp. SIO2B7]|nr:hypothetical protein [Moorena sp. SIO2B7]
LLASLEQAIAAIKPYEKDVSIAAINGPLSIVISGKREAINAVTGVRYWGNFLRNWCKGRFPINFWHCKSFEPKEVITLQLFAQKRLKSLI